MFHILLVFCCALTLTSTERVSWVGSTSSVERLAKGLKMNGDPQSYEEDVVGRLAARNGPRTTQFTKKQIVK